MAFPRRASRLVILTGIVLGLLLILRLLPHAIRRPSIPFVPSSRDWSTFQHHHPPGNLKSLPSGRPRKLPQVQADASLFPSSNVNDYRRETVRRAFKRSYLAYKEHAWMRDELMPLSGDAKDPFGGWAATLVDSLDTMWIMGLDEDFQEAATAVASIDWAVTKAGAANIFETTIRHLGGLLSAYDLSGEKALLLKAVELAEMLYVGFDTPNRMPGFWLNFKEAEAGNQFAGTHDASASPTSLCLEFTRLSQITGDPKYYDATDRITRFLERTQNGTSLPGMWPLSLDLRNELADDNTYTLGAMADSLYEYLPKMHALLGGVDGTYEAMYRYAMNTTIEYFLFRPMTPNQEDVLFSGDVRVYGDPELVPRSQHLTCFIGGMFGLGSKLFNIPSHLDIGSRLARGCGWAYASFPTGIMPEIFDMIPCPGPGLGPCAWDAERWESLSNDNLPKGFKQARDPRYQLRPEAIESIFLLYRITGKADLREIAWNMFQAIMTATSTDLANAAIENVSVEGETSKVDSMESFWMAETLKYFYLIFSPPDVIDLDEWVFNTEAHPFRRRR